MEKGLDFAFLLRAQGVAETVANLQKVSENVQRIGEVASAVAESGAFVAIAEGMKKIFESAAGMQLRMADLAAATGLGNEQLEKLKMVAAPAAAAIAAPLSHAGGAGAPITINITYAPVIPPGAAGDLGKTLEAYAHKLADIIEREMERRARTRW